MEIGQAWWVTPVIPDAWEVMSQGQPRQNVSKFSILTQKSGVMAGNCGPSYLRDHRQEDYGLRLS
jgi:hypothetical protein